MVMLLLVPNGPLTEPVELVRVSLYGKLSWTLHKI